MTDYLVSDALASTDRFVRAIVSSLFTWRRANSDDVVLAGSRMGWWGDSFAMVPNDRIGSRLWLLQREVLLPPTFARAKEYAEEALQWLLDDGVAARVDVVAERYGLSGLAIGVQIFRADGVRLADPRFTNVWETLNV